jgi:hypothetical protein
VTRPDPELVEGPARRGPDPEIAKERSGFGTQSAGTPVHDLGAVERSAAAYPHRDHADRLRPGG